MRAIAKKLSIVVATSMGGLGALLLASSLSACGPAAKSTTMITPPKGVVGATSSSGAGFKNASRCDSTKAGREVSYHDLAGLGRPDMLEVIAFGKTSTGLGTGHVVCMEIDTNHDGTLDLLRVFSDAGDLETEEADRNYDGKMDVWLTYDRGTLMKAEFDVTFHGAVDEIDHYKDGKLKWIERDRNDDGHMDVYEYYVNGKLERMGVDLNGDGRVDTWYRDEIARAEQRKIDSAAAAASAASAAASTSAAPSASAPVRGTH